MGSSAWNYSINARASTATVLETRWLKTCESQATMKEGLSFNDLGWVGVSRHCKLLFWVVSDVPLTRAARMKPYGDTWRHHRKMMHQSMNVRDVDRVRKVQSQGVHVFLKRLVENPSRFLDQVKQYVKLFSQAYMGADIPTASMAGWVILKVCIWESIKLTVTHFFS